MVAIGPDRGGIFGIPLSIGGLAEAIRSFQTFQKLPARDGKVNKNGNTLKRINEILNPGAFPIPPIPPSPFAGTGTIKNMPDMSTSIDKVVWSPVESSLVSETPFKWSSVKGNGKVFFFELDEDVVPNWFGVVVPNGVTSFEHLHIFFHPTASNLRLDDKEYKTPGKGRFRGILHYLTDDMTVQFCAAQTGQVLVMPLLTTGVKDTCGIFPQRWESIVGQMLGQIASGSMSQSASPQAISSVVVSSFSNGITYSAAFRNRAKLGAKLRSTIDFDGIISTFKDKSLALPQSALRFWQSAASGPNLFALSASNLFPLPNPRWASEGGPFKGGFKGNFQQIMLQIHGRIPQTMMHFAAKRTAAS